MRNQPLAATIFCVAALLYGCSSTPVVDEEPVETTPPPVEEYTPPTPVPHDGPLSTDLDVYDCGEIPEGYTCEFEAILTQISGDALVIDSVAQNFSPYARVDLLEHSTAFGRDLPYTMSSGEELRVVFYYRRDDPNEELGGSVFISYEHGSESFRMEIPIGVEE